MKRFEVIQNEIPLIEINEVEQGRPASFFAFHGSNKPFVTATPSERFPTIFYADSPEVASTYPWGKHLGDLNSKNLELSKDPQILIGAKILRTQEEKQHPDIEGRSFRYTLNEVHLKEPEVIEAKDRLKSDIEFRTKAEKLLLSWKTLWNAEAVKGEEVVDYETGPMGSVKKYLITTQNPAVLDFEGHTWGDLKNESGEWLTPTKKASTELLQQEWNSWLNSFFEKGHDVIVVKNIRDVGSNIGGKILEPHTIVIANRHTEIETEQPKN